VRAVFHPGKQHIDPELRHFDARFEATRYPEDLLWGPGSNTDAAAWFAEHRPEPDQCDYLNRTFVVRLDGDQLYMPMRPSVAAALPEGERGGTWYAIKADHPNDAFNHVRNLVTGVACTRIGPCRQCHAETLGIGAYQDIAASFARPAADLTPSLPPDASTPWANPRSRKTTASPGHGLSPSGSGEQLPG
jgi:hypothetical protein